jgi:hypothetical protein
MIYHQLLTSKSLRRRRKFQIEYCHGKPEAYRYVRRQKAQVRGASQLTFNLQLN